MPTPHRIAFSSRAALAVLAGAMAVAPVRGADVPGARNAYPAGAAAARAGTPPRAVPILDGSGVWRVLHSWNVPPVHVEEGLVGKKARGPRLGVFDFLTAYPPDGWTGIEFDDSRWARQHYRVKYASGECAGRMGSGAPNPFLRQLSLRGKFTVTDPAKVNALRVDLAYRGGAVVYVNGKEVGRGHVPSKDFGNGTPADMYDRKAHLKDDGKPWSRPPDAAAMADLTRMRVRRLEKLAIPPELLVKGMNVLAVEIHAARYPVQCFWSGAVPWSTAGLIELHLRADGPEGIVPNVLRPEGVQVWNCNLIEEVTEDAWADPHEKLSPIRLAGARNGCYSGKVVVSSDKPIRGLKASVTDLALEAGAGSKPVSTRFPASAIRVSYGRFWRIRGGRLRDDAMVDAPLDEAPIIPVTSDPEARAADGLPPLTGGAYQSVYITARIPKDAAPGEYRGALTITWAGAEKPVAVPVELNVIDWTLPDPADFTYWLGLIQSPDAVGLYHQVPMWSDRHFELIGKSFDLIGQTGGKVLFIHLLAQTEYGNDHSMVLWGGPEGGLSAPVDWSRCTHDFSRVDKYVATAVKHMGGGSKRDTSRLETSKPRFVILGVWQVRRKHRSPLVSVTDPRSGAIRNVKGPEYGSPESLGFWKPVLTGVREILLEAGIKDEAILLGYAGDFLPDPKTVGVFRQILPRAGWQASRHASRGGERIPCAGGEPVEVRYTSNVYGNHDNWDPKVKRVHGWNFKYPVRGGLRTWLDRTTYDTASLPRFRCLCEQALLADRPGLGQIGADFWPKPPDAPGGYRLPTLYSRFPESANGGPGNRGCTTNQLLYPDPGGAAPTVRFELVRENIQECEARIYLEKLLILPQPRPLSAELAAEAQAVLDERTRWHRLNYTFHGCPDAGGTWRVGQILKLHTTHNFRACPDAGTSWACSGWEARSERLYEVAAEAAKAVSADNEP